MDGESKLKDEPVTITAPPNSVTIDPQNPLPEPNFFWRRVIAMIVTFAALAMTWHNVEALHDLRDAPGLLNLAKWIICFAALVLTYYFVAPSASELTSMIQSAKIIKSGLAMASQPSTASERADFRAAQSDSEPSGSADTGEPPAASPAPVSGDEEDAAPRGRT